MYSLNLLNEEFEMDFRYTTRKLKQYIGKASEMTWFKKIPRVHHINKGD